MRRDFFNPTEEKEERNALLWNTLVKYVPSPKVESILEVGCGSGLDIRVLRGFFGRKAYLVDDPSIAYLGVDASAHQIKDAQDILEGEGTDTCELRLIHGDAKWLDCISDRKFDVVAILHPNIYHNDRNWELIIPSAAGSHRKGGVLLSAFYQANELDRMEANLRKYYRKVFSGWNEYAKHYSVLNFKYIYVGRRR